MRLLGRLQGGRARVRRRRRPLALGGPRGARALGRGGARGPALRRGRQPRRRRGGRRRRRRRRLGRRNAHRGRRRGRPCRRAAHAAPAAAAAAAAAARGVPGRGPAVDAPFGRRGRALRRRGRRRARGRRHGRRRVPVLPLPGRRLRRPRLGLLVQDAPDASLLQQTRGGRPERRGAASGARPRRRQAAGLCRLAGLDVRGARPLAAPCAQPRSPPPTHTFSSTATTHAAAAARR